MRLLDSHCHSCKLLAGLPMQRRGEEVVKRDETRCLPFPEETVLWVLLHEAEQTQLFSLVAPWTRGADSDNSLSLSANTELPWQSAERRPRVPFLGLVYSDWNCTPVPWDLTLFIEFSGGREGAEVRFSAETSEPNCSLKHPLLPSLCKPAASAPSSPSQK